MSDARLPPRESLQAAMERRMARRTRTKGELSWPAAPALLPLYRKRLGDMFAAMGKPFAESELDDMEEMIRVRVGAAWKVSPHGKLHVSWEPEKDGGGVEYTVWYEVGTVAEQYDDWNETHEQPLFGKNPDAKLVQVAGTLEPTGDHPILDIGAGTGRNALPMAAKGHPVTAVEITPKFADMLRQKPADAKLALTVVEGDAASGNLELEESSFSVVLCSEVTPHFRTAEQLRTLFESAARWLRPGGTFVVNVFLALPGYEPTDLERQLGQVFWCTFFTREELDGAAAGLGLALVSDDPVEEFERAHQPGESWPPTSWFEEWAGGWDVFAVKEGERPPIELRWLCYRKAEADAEGGDRKADGGDVEEVGTRLRDQKLDD
ncbi:S-adenosyl-L-methionine-dependent methyltransferase [Hyaloraphidium curvatum]|nr:S-adenosyl-L-methionine-dependent methyltransferase [Hyaloraphidium curvatum]